MAVIESPALDLDLAARRVPIKTKSKAMPSLAFDVTFDCANDPVKASATKTNSFVARVDHFGARRL
jgi:hypothetical protein